MEDTRQGPVGHDDSRWHQLVGMLGSLLVAGILGAVATFAAVKSLDTNISLFRDEVRREFDWYQAQMSRVERKLDTHLEDNNHNQ